MASLTRRSVLKLFGGATAGAILSPLPWKLLDDVTIWTQNWSWLARPLRGPISYRHTTCTLCPAGCGLRLRQVASVTVSARGVPGHPVSEGRICPIGIGAAQVRFHPARIRGAVRRTRSESGAGWRLVDADEAIAVVGRRLSELRAAGRAERAGILDLRPGRSLSALYREFLSRAGGGRYLTLPGERERCAAALSGLIDGGAVCPGYDFARAGAVISFGAPLFDGWFGAGPVPGLMRGRPGAGSERAPYMVHVESNGSPTASRADRWIPIRPGTEAALALGLGRVLIGEGLAEGDVLTRAAVRQKGSQQEYAGLISSFTPEEAGRVTGVDPGLIRSTARELAARRPVIAVGGGAPGAGPLGEDEERAIWALNLLFGSVGRPGGVRLREDLAELFAERPCLPEESLWELPDGSLDLLLVDGSIPGTPVPADLLRRKLSGHGSLLVGMSPFIAGPTSEADIVLPTPAPGEWLDDVPPQALASRTSYGCSAAVVRPPEWACHGAEMLKRFLEAAGEESWPGTGEETIEQLIRGRIEALYAWGEGAVFDAERGETVDTTSIGSADRLAGILTRGGCWVEDADRAPRQATIRWSGSGWEMNTRIDEKALRLPAEPDGKEGKYPLLLILSGRLEVAGGGVLPPVTNKLYRESNLLLGARRAEVNSATAREHGLADRRPAELKTPYGTMEVTVVHDDSVMPGVIRMSPGPDPACFGDTTDRGPDVLDLCGASERPAWRVTRAMLREV